MLKEEALSENRIF